MKYYDGPHPTKDVFITTSSDTMPTEISSAEAANDYPCSGHDCYDRGNYHVSCKECLFYYGKRKDGSV